MPRRRHAARGGAAAIRAGRASSLPPVSAISLLPPRLDGTTILYPVCASYPKVFAMDVRIRSGRKLVNFCCRTAGRRDGPSFNGAGGYGTVQLPTRVATLAAYF